MTKTNLYQGIVEDVFFRSYAPGSKIVPFGREELFEAAARMGNRLPKNVGDVIYSIRYRTAMPERVAATAPPGMEWIIEGVGRSAYQFHLRRFNRIVPNAQLLPIKVPDATPEIVKAYSLSDEQALLARVRYNRLIDLFLRINAYSLQNHLRTTVASVGQIEIDELYVGIDDSGQQYIVPVQAKGGSDQLSVVQTTQDIRCCNEKFPSLKCRALSAQFMDGSTIAMFELVIDHEGELRIAKEKHYRLVPQSDITAADLELYAGL